jgi:hypothetical protein
MQGQEIEAPVQCVGHRESREKHRFPGPAYKPVIKAAAFLLARGRFPEQIQH